MSFSAMTWNVLLGGEERFELIVGVIARTQPDLLVLQECLGWEDRARLERIATALGIPSSQAHLGQARPRGSGKRYHVAILTRAPSRVIAVHSNPSFIGHCIVELDLDLAPRTRVFGAHFDSHAENLRFVEARYLRSIIDRDAFERNPFLLLGDLNSLSSRDPYPADHGEKVRAAGIDKYGHPPRFEVIADLESFGWIDARPAGNWVTAARDRAGVHIDNRTDYVFASPSLAARLVAAEVIDVGSASDHHALIAHFNV